MYTNKLIGYLLMFMLGWTSVCQESRNSLAPITYIHGDSIYEFKILNKPATRKGHPEKTYYSYENFTLVEHTGGHTGSLLDGPYSIKSYSNNQLIAKGKIKKGIKHGEWRIWYKSGKLRSLETWRKGIKTGKFQFYAEDGNLLTEGKYKDGVIMDKTWWERVKGIFETKSDSPSPGTIQEPDEGDEEKKGWFSFLKRNKKEETTEKQLERENRRREKEQKRDEKRQEKENQNSDINRPQDQDGNSETSSTRRRARN